MNQNVQRRKAVCAVTKKVIRKYGWINRNFLVKMSFRNWSPAFAIEMFSDEFSLKHALKYRNMTMSPNNMPYGAVHKVRHARGEGVREGVTVCDRGEGVRAC